MKLDPPDISVIIPAYNSETYIRESINSILEQSFSNWEMIVVNDGSTDHTPAIIQEYILKDQRIKLIMQENSGSALARRTGFLNSQGKYIYFLDADDRSKPTTLERLYLALERWTEAVAAYGKIVEIDISNNVIFQPGSIVEDLVPIDMFPRTIERGIFCIGGVCIRRNFLNQEDFLTDLTIGEDWLFWCRLTAKGPFIFIGEEAIIEIRRHNTNKTKLPISKLVESWNKSREVIFTDPAIRQKLPPKLLAKHSQINKFYTYYDVTKLCWRLKAYDLTTIYFGKSIITALENPLAFLHIMGRFNREVWRYFRYFIKNPDKY
ncbi:glycosyltransferase family 2 protein [Nodularia harveyana UHCC-0300]|uniref:Glycosyltransferase family 2 protein n=1 Tax=Nodularia harveyana UHCC-0300 TaxID=2974287 RepID=A0ABU5UI20_9CYAN|nr:glycosyltransferase family 2 protein [Nodularia harveyana]MEA5583193.1 glycosyltransferase family 2 protein [Nodularia harveyana UHCC-0300]